MYKLTYVESIELLVCTLDASVVKDEVKKRIRKELQSRTGISKILVIEGSFEVVKKDEEIPDVLTS